MSDKNIRNKAQAESTASAVWSGNLIDGSGSITRTGSGAFGNLPVTWAARTTELMERTTRAGQGAVGSEGVLVDMAHLKLADSISQRQALIERQAGR